MFDRSMEVPVREIVKTLILQKIRISAIQVV